MQRDDEDEKLPTRVPLDATADQEDAQQKSNVYYTVSSSESMTSKPSRKPIEDPTSQTRRNDLFVHPTVTLMGVQNSDKGAVNCR